jgi:hypothetical protein
LTLFTKKTPLPGGSIVATGQVHRGSDPDSHTA